MKLEGNMDNTSTSPAMVLIVDDVAKNIQVVAGFLKPEGYQLAFAQNGKAAIEQVKKQPIDLILLDVMMPDMDGYEVCSTLKASPSTQHIPIIFLTGKAETDDVVHGLAIGAVDYVTKPFQRDELLARVKTHLELKRAREHILNLYEQMDDELDLAAELQMTVMRTEAEVPFLTTQLEFKPYGKVSGDVVDFWTDGSTELRVFVGDVIGHGIPSALIAMMIHSILDSREDHEYTNGVLSRINHVLSNRRLSGKFVTGIYTKIGSDGNLSTCGAGHPAMIILPANGAPLVKLGQGGIAMGVSSATRSPYVEQTYQLEIGDKLFLYTDGIYDWPNPECDRFGLSQLESCLEGNRHATVQSILNDVMKRIEAFSEGTACDDDYTLLGIEYLGT